MGERGRPTTWTSGYNLSQLQFVKHLERVDTSREISRISRVTSRPNFVRGPPFGQVQAVNSIT